MFCLLMLRSFSPRLLKRSLSRAGRGTTQGSTLRVFSSLLSSFLNLEAPSHIPYSSCDSQDGKTGTHSYLAKFCDNSIMFHVGPLIPTDKLVSSSHSSSILEALESQNEPDFRPHMERDDYIKNNVVCVVYLANPNLKFSPAQYSSKYIRKRVYPFFSNLCHKSPPPPRLSRHFHCGSGRNRRLSHERGF